MSSKDFSELKSGRGISGRLDGTSKPGYVDAGHLRGLTGGLTLDANTYIGLNNADRMRFVAGNVEFMDFSQDGGIFTIGEDSTTYPLTILTQTSMSRDLWVSGSGTVVGDLLVRGDATINGNLTFGNSTTDSISFGAEVSSSIIPDANTTYDIGSTNKRWDVVYANQVSASGTGSFNTIVSQNDINVGQRLVHYGDNDTYINFSGDDQAFYPYFGVGANNICFNIFYKNFSKSI